MKKIRTNNFEDGRYKKDEKILLSELNKMV